MQEFRSVIRRKMRDTDILIQAIFVMNMEIVFVLVKNLLGIKTRNEISRRDQVSYTDPNKTVTTQNDSLT